MEKCLDAHIGDVFLKFSLELDGFLDQSRARLNVLGNEWKRKAAMRRNEESWAN